MAPSEENVTNSIDQKGKDDLEKVIKDLQKVELEPSKAQENKLPNQEENKDKGR